MNDMRAVIVPKSDQLNSDDLIENPMIVTITKVTIRPGTDQPVSIYFEGDKNKPYKPCKSMARVMVHCWGPDANDYAGKSMRLFRDPKVPWGGMAVGGIRISHMSHIDSIQTMALTETKKSRKPYTVEPLRMEKPKPANQAAANATAAPTTQADPAAKEAAMVAAVDDMTARLDAANTTAAIQDIIGGADVQKRRDWLHAKRDALSERLEAAIDRAL